MDPFWVPIAALVFAAFSGVNAIVSLYDRFIGRRRSEGGPIAYYAGSLALWIFNVIGLALLVVVVVAVWFPRQESPKGPNPPEVHPIPPLGHISWFNLYNALKAIPTEVKQKPPKYFVLISQPKENFESGRELGTLFLTTFPESGLGALNLPDYTTDLDAPKFESKGPPGITVHGRNVAADYIAVALSHCYQIHQTAEMPTGAVEYYRGRYPTMSADAVLIWLEMGKGSPFQDGFCIGVGN